MLYYIILYYIILYYIILYRHLGWNFQELNPYLKFSTSLEKRIEQVLIEKLDFLMVRLHSSLAFPDL